jgi:hypothetical protein
VAAITYEWRISFQDILSYLNPEQARRPALRASASRARARERERERERRFLRVQGVSESPDHSPERVRGFSPW